MISYIDYIPLMKALADETRLQIIDMLSCGESSCACKLLEHFAFTQPTLSYHMRILTESGLVKGVGMVPGCATPWLRKGPQN